MTTITLKTSTAPKVHEDRRKPADVLGVADAGPSPRGSSYYARLVTCPREHALATRAGLRRAGDAEALTVGWLFHQALEAYFRSLAALQEPLRGNLPTRQADWVSLAVEAEKVAYAAIAPVEREPGYAETYAQLEKMLQCYFEHYRQEDRFRVIAVEETIEVRRPFPYSARIDTVVECLNRKGMWIIEHKTAKALTADVMEGYQLNWQVLGQCWLLERAVDLTMYPEFWGLLVNIVTKNVQPKMIRVEVRPSRDHLLAFKRMVTAWHKMEAVYERAGWPPDFTKCAGYSRGYSRCQFFDLCYARPTLRVQDIAAEDAPFGFEKLTNEGERV